MSNAAEIKDDRKYTKEHEWAKLDRDVVVVGVSAFAVDQLGDITLVNYDVAPGDRVEAGKVFGTIESVKTLSDLFSPIGGEVVEVNLGLEDAPELVNDDCWEKGWMLKLRCDDPSAIDALLTPEGYGEFVKESD